MLVNSPDQEKRLIAFRSLRNAGQAIVPLVSMIAEKEPSAAVRREAALALRDVPAERKHTLLVSLIKKYEADDRTYLEACGMGAQGADTDQLWKDLKKTTSFEDPTKWSEAFARITWRLRPLAAIKDLLKRAREQTLSMSARLLAIETLAFYDDPLALPPLLQAASNNGPVGAEATRWLIHLGNTRWRKYGVYDALKKAAIYDPDQIKITGIVVPAVEGKSKMPPISEILKLKGDAEKGKITAARCIMCHRIGGLGIDYGPSLEGWIQNQGNEKFVQSLIDPSSEIAHGYSGSRIQLKDGIEIHGLTLSAKNPLIVQSQGGIVQVIPSGRVKSVESLGRSLMLSAEQLGMKAQDVMDVLAYLKSLPEEAQ